MRNVWKIQSMDHTNVLDIKCVIVVPRSWRAESCECRDVSRQTMIKVPYLDCRLITRKHCRTVPVTECQKVTEEKCESLTNTVCTVSPQVDCRDIKRKVPHTLQRRKPVEVCQESAVAASSQDGEGYVIEV